ncbi:HTH_Tnp_Tc3_2 domain-containing protein [Trichonephila clavipes]|nr:HTH_Tnp_Tc3_2 domain-containing protein [Trichonephila clavipes]
MGSRTRGRPPTRWIDDVENDLKSLNIKNWQRVAAYRWNWRKRAMEAAKTCNRKTTRREDRRSVRPELVDPTVTRSTIRADVGVAIVPRTISRHLAEANLKSKHPFRALPLTTEHRQLRLQ